MKVPEYAWCDQRNMFIPTGKIVTVPDDPMTTIYVVESGGCSDCDGKELNGVYSSRELADEAAKLYCGEVVELRLDAMPERREGLYYWSVCMEKDGQSKQQPQVFPQPVDAKPYHGEYYTVVNFYVWAKNESDAVNVANERRIQILAENKWGEAGTNYL